jgi:hypothetical protein
MGNAPGDSLIEKIFSGGIHGTDAVVVLLSATSVNSRGGLPPGNEVGLR